MSIFAKLVNLENFDKDYALCTVVSVQGSTPRKAGAKMIIIDNGLPEGHIVGTIGGGAIEHAVRRQAVMLLHEKKTKLINISLRNDLGMCCGGEMSIFIEPIIKQPPFFCFGAGHIAQALCPLAVNLGYRVVVVDERRALLEQEVFSACERKEHNSSFDLAQLTFKDSFIVIATHDHGLDQHIAEHIIDKPFLYAALIGSQRKALMTQKRLRAKGFSEVVSGRLRCPAGLAIHADTPQEIAVSIMAEMTLVKHAPHHPMRHDSSSRKKQSHGVSQSIAQV